MEFHQLRYFLAVADTASFTRAAARCSVAQPSLSQQIKKLEQQVGAPLFDRRNRVVTLTEIGRALLPRARRIIAEVTDAHDRLAQDMVNGTGPLRVGVIPTIGPFMLPTVMRRFLKQYPECELSVEEDLTERLLQRISEHQLDFAVTSTPVSLKGAAVEVIGTEPLLVAAPPDFHWPRGKPFSLAQLRQQPIVMVTEAHCLGRQIQEFCTRSAVGLRVVCGTAQIDTLQRLVAGGLGFSLVPAMAARADTHRTCRYLAIDEPALTREIAVVWPLNRQHSFLATEFLRLVRKIVPVRG